MTQATQDHLLEPWDESQVVKDWGDELLDAEIKLPKRQLEESEMDITPMIDITFLLLIFFIVASKMDEAAQVPLPPARHGIGVVTKDSLIITVTSGEGDVASIYMGDSTDEAVRVQSTDLAEQEQELIAYIQQGVLENKQQVIIKAERQVKTREVARVARAVGAVDGVGLYVAVLERQ